MSTTDVEVHARVVEGSSYSPLCDLIRHLWFVLIVHVTLDWGLITSLVKRWCLETHTFYLPIGEMMITLQDVTIILGLRPNS